MRGAYPPLTDSAEVAAARRELYRGEEDAADLFLADSGASSLALLMMCGCGHDLGSHDQWEHCVVWECKCWRFQLAEEEGA